MHQFCRLCAVAGLALVVNGSCAAQPAEWAEVSADELDTMRGGFMPGQGLAVSFGLERLVSLNGSVVSHTTLHVADVTHLSAEQAQQTRDALSTLKLVQAGHDNILVRSPPEQALGPTVIQNTLNDQVIRSQTVITASVNSVALLQALRFEHSLVEAIAGSANPH